MLRTVTLALLALLLTASTASAQEPTPLPAPPGSEAEPNQTPEVEPNGQTRQPLGGDRFVSGTTAVTDQDVFRLELGAGDTVFLSLDLDPERDGESFNGRAMFGNETVLVANDPGNSDAVPSEAFVGTVSVDGAISDLRLGSRCVRRTSTGRVRVPMTMQLAQPSTVRVRVDRALGSRGRSSCPQANPERNLRFRRVATFRPVAQVRAASLPRQVMLDLRLRPGLYRLTVRVQLGDGRLSAPTRRFLRVVS